MDGMDGEEHQEGIPAMVHTYAVVHSMWEVDVLTDNGSRSVERF